MTANAHNKVVSGLRQALLKSAMTEKGGFVSVDEVLPWLESRCKASTFEVRQIPLDELNDWCFHADEDYLGHKTGKFFKIRGIETRITATEPERLYQPIIDQPEIGILGIIAKQFDGVLHFLMQAKMEPGNVNLIQLSPTVQATKSNYTQVHRGAKPRYIEYFLHKTKANTLVDQLQSEQGSFFFKKRNRNIVIETEEDVKLHEDFCWLTLGQIKRLMKENNVVNMDARSVISCLSYSEGCMFASDWQEGESFGNAGSQSFCNELLASMLANQHCKHDLTEIISWFTNQKTNCELETRKVGLKEMAGWRRSDFSIEHETGRNFSVIAVSVRTGSREVSSWTQPLVKPVEQGKIGFIVKRINGILHFLVQARAEPGNFDMVELGPTVQYLQGSAMNNGQSNELEFLRMIKEAPAGSVRFRAIQSEEGGRFYHYQNENSIIQIEDDHALDIPDNYAWITLGQMLLLIQQNNVFNMEARSLLACLSFV